MSRAIKTLVESDLKKQYGAIDSVLVINLLGLNGNQANAFRNTLRKSEVEVHIVKNSAVRRALADTVLEPLTARLTGPCAFVTGGRSPVDTAKELIRLTGEYPALELKIGLVEGEPDIFTIEEISKRRSRAELQGEIIMLAVSPARRIAGQLNVGGRVAGCIKAMIDKLEKGERIAKVA